jgi:hypothetical protein
MNRVLPLIAALSILFPLQSLWAGDGTGLVTSMGRLQYFTHKLGLAIDTRNQALQAFYAHEVEEVIEHIETMREVDGVPIGQLVESNLVPPFEVLDAAVEVGDPARVDHAYDALIEACNHCHKAANRPYIHVERRVDNPYMQNFGRTP